MRSPRVDAEHDVRHNRAIAKHTAMMASKPAPNRAAAKKAGMPSTIGDEPRIEKQRHARIRAFDATMSWSCP